MNNVYRPMYLCGWFIFDAKAQPFRSSRKISLEWYNTAEDARVLAAIYTRIYYS